MTIHSQTPTLGLQLDWQAVPFNQNLSLEKDELHVWCVPLKLKAGQVEQAVSLLNETQHDKYQRRAVQQQQISYLAGRFYLNYLLCAYTGCQNQKIELSYGRLKKPHLSNNPQQLHFNYTDTVIGNRAWGLFAFARHAEVGVDLESLERRSKFDIIAGRRFSSAEQNFVREADGSINPHRFLAIWTRKEAYGKATGRGINFVMRELDLASPGLHELNFTDNSRPALPFNLTQIQIEPDLISAVVVEGHEPRRLQAFTLTS